MVLLFRLDAKLSSNYKFDVALSYASEQIEYVRKVAQILEKNGVRIFFDEFKKSHLWGKELTTYFKEVYYSQSKHCIMFASKEYFSKAWPSFERKQALARQLEVGDDYILPVKFDDNDIPGLASTIAYLDARKEPPEEIARLFLEKLENSA